MWVWSQPKSPEIANIFEWGVGDWWAWFHDMWDGIVISAPSFPRNYWDKQVKDRVSTALYVHEQCILSGRTLDFI